jgi:hypothetical protein
MDPRQIQQELAAPFRADQVRCRPGALSGDKAKALAIFYVNPKTIQQRLDDVLGVDGWADECEVLPDGCVVCRLTVWFGDRAVTRCDVGAPSKQPDAGDRLKAAFSGALKRAALKFGVGRYLDGVPQQWAELDGSGKRFKKTPRLPAEFLPPPAQERAPAPAAPPKQPTRAETSALMRDRYLARTAAAEDLAALEALAGELTPGVTQALGKQDLQAVRTAWAARWAELGGKPLKKTA